MIHFLPLRGGKRHKSVLGPEGLDLNLRIPAGIFFFFLSCVNLGKLLKFSCLCVFICRMGLMLHSPMVRLTELMRDEDLDEH